MLKPFTENAVTDMVPAENGPPDKAQVSVVEDVTVSVVHTGVGPLVLLKVMEATIGRIAPFCVKPVPVIVTLVAERARSPWSSLIVGLLAMVATWTELEEPPATVTTAMRGPTSENPPSIVHCSEVVEMRARLAQGTPTAFKLKATDTSPRIAPKLDPPIVTVVLVFTIAVVTLVTTGSATIT